MRLMLACVTLGLLLAGCSGGGTDDDSDDDGTQVTGNDGGTSASSSTAATTAYTLTVSEFPPVALNKGSAFSFKLAIAGPGASSDHLGAHFTNHAVPNPMLSAYDGACNHVAGTVPGDYVVTCTAPSTSGTYYLRGHLRTGTEPTATHSWSAEQTFSVN